jgi:3-oxoadipate enol-lactonase
MRETNFVTMGDGCRIAYRLDGDPALPRLVLSNSIATTLHMWDDQIGALTQDFCVLRFDTRGHGLSDAPGGAYSVDRLGRDVIELLDALNLDRVDFCGLSLGGFIGQWLAIHAPDRIRRLVLSNTSPHLGPASSFDELIAKVLGTTDMAPIADMFMHNWFPDAMLSGPNAIVDRFRAMAQATPPQGLAGCLAAVRDADFSRTIALVDCPTLVIGGQDDRVTLASHSEMIASAIAGAKLLILPGVHMLNVQLQAEFMRAVRGFLVPPEG